MSCLLIVQTELRFPCIGHRTIQFEGCAIGKMKRDEILVHVAIGILLIFMGIGASRYPTQNPIISAIFLIVFAIPSVLLLFRSMSLSRGIIILGLFGIFPLIIESVGVTTGLPYGEFSYTVAMGPRIFGLVPWTVFFVFSPILIGTIAIAQRATHRPLYAVILSAFFLVLYDLVLDPCAVHAGFWIWSNPGLYYGVPASNFLGWLLIGLLASAILFSLVSSKSRLHRGTIISVFLSISFWTGYSINSGLLIPILLGIPFIVFTVNSIIREEQAD